MTARAPVTDDAFDKYWVAVSTGDAASAVEIALQLRDAGVGIPQVLDRLVAAAQNEVGRLWSINEWDVAQEHRATSIGEEVVAALTAGLVADPNGRSVIVTCVDGEWHSLPSRILTAALRSAGWRVTYLGASVPARHLTQMLHDLGPDMVALSCALPTRLLHARQMIETSRAAGVPVVVGGPGFGPAGRWGLQLGASAWAANARAALTSIEVPSFVDPAPPLRMPDDTAYAIRAHRAELVTACMAALDRLAREQGRLPDVAAYTDEQRARTEEDFGHIVDFLAAALFVDDTDLFIAFTRWLQLILVARGVPSRTLVAGLDLLGRELDLRFGRHERVANFVATGRDAVS